MPNKSNTLYISESTLPGAGKGLFTREAIQKGSRILEYKGRIRTWKEVEDAGVFNGYVLYMTANHVIDASTYLKSLGRYANDAKGLVRIKGITNNAEYREEGKRVFIHATRNIPPGGEILVDYGKEYWDVVKENNRIEKAEAKRNRKQVKSG